MLSKAVYFWEWKMSLFISALGQQALTRIDISKLEYMITFTIAVIIFIFFSQFFKIMFSRKLYSFQNVLLHWQRAFLSSYQCLWDHFPSFFPTVYPRFLLWVLFVWSCLYLFLFLISTAPRYNILHDHFH